MSQEPFPTWVSVETDLVCPKCGEEAVVVRELATYVDDQQVPAACTECRARLYVTAVVDIMFICPETRTGALADE